MLRALMLWILLPAALLAQAPTPKTAAPAPAAVVPMTDEEKTVYALGLLVQRSFRQFDLTPSELEIVKHALSDGAAGKPSSGFRVSSRAGRRGSRR